MGSAAQDAFRVPGTQRGPLQAVGLGPGDHTGLHRAPGSRRLSEQGGTQPHSITHRRNQRSPIPYLSPQIPERGHRHRGSFRSSITMVATTCAWGKEVMSGAGC